MYTGFNAKNEIQLERKEDMKKRGLHSPDLADAFVLTFAQPVQAKTAIEKYAEKTGGASNMAITDYPLFE